MKHLCSKILTTAMMLATLASCGPKPSASPETENSGQKETSEGGDDGHGHEGGAESGASFKEGKGIQLSGEARKALGVTTEEVGSRKIAPAIKVTAQVYRAARETESATEKSGAAYASAFVDGAAAKRLRVGEPIEIAPPSDGAAKIPGTLKNVDLSLIPSSGKAEVLLESLDPEGRLKLGEFITASIPESAGEQEVVAIPLPALLETSSGKFAYVQNGEFLLRTPVTTGPASDGFVEIIDGLYEGDTIAATGAEALYLIELRATKGGGHSH